MWNIKNGWTSFSDKECKYLYDYITNLQQENERLKENNMSYEEEMAKTWKITDDYKSRFEKAIEYIKERFYFNEETGEYSLLHTFDKCNVKELLDILKEVE